MSDTYKGVPQLISLSKAASMLSAPLTEVRVVVERLQLKITNEHYIERSDLNRVRDALKGATDEEVVIQTHSLDSLRSKFRSDGGE